MTGSSSHRVIFLSKDVPFEIRKQEETVMAINLGYPQETNGMALYKSGKKECGEGGVRSTTEALS